MKAAFIHSMDKEVALITGGTSGIGAAFARHFAREGYDLIITGKPNGKIYPCIEKLHEQYNVNVEIVLAEFADSARFSLLCNQAVQQ